MASSTFPLDRLLREIGQNGKRLSVIGAAGWIYATKSRERKARTVWLNRLPAYWLRDVYWSRTGGYVAGKAEGDTGWLFTVGDEIGSRGYVEIFLDMFNSMDKGKAPMETFYDSYNVNAIIDACYKVAETKRWEPVEIKVWRGVSGDKKETALKEYDNEHYLIEEKMPNGNLKIILKD